MDMPPTQGSQERAERAAVLHNKLWEQCKSGKPDSARDGSQVGGITRSCGVQGLAQYYSWDGGGCGTCGSSGGGKGR